MRYRSTGFLLVILILLTFTGCTGLMDQGQLNLEPAAEVNLDTGHTAGQTFVSRFAGLNGIQVWLEPAQNSRGKIAFHLRASPAAADLAAVDLPLADVTVPGFYTFTFPPLADSSNRYLYFFLEVKDGPPAQVGTRAGDTYLDGAFQQDHRPQDAQLVFQTVYAPGYLLLDLVRTIAVDAGLLLASTLLFIVPGWALLTLLGRFAFPELHWIEGLGVAAGLSVALYPLLMLWTNLAGLQLDWLNGWLPVLAGFGILGWHYRPWQLRWGRIANVVKGWPSSNRFWPELSAIVVIILIGLGRFLAIRELAMPLWHDSVQHTTMVARMLEADGLYQSWEPYAPYQTLSFHFGFHANAAAWAWLTGSNAPQAVLWAGQALNLLAVLALYPLAFRLSGAWAGVIAVVAAGMLNPFPMTYTNWGRYPQLSGQIVLPVAAWWLWVTLNDGQLRGRSLSYIVGGAGLVAGMILAYYRMAFHYLTFVAAALLTLLWAKPSKYMLNKWLWLTLISMAGLAGILVLPWFYHVATRYELVAAQPAVQAVAGGPVPDQLASTINKLREAVVAAFGGWPWTRVALFSLSLVVGILARRAIILPALWLLILVSSPVLRSTSLPGVQIIQEFTIATSLYIPTALMLGALGGYLAEKIIDRPSTWRPALLGMALIAVSLWRFPSQLALIDRAYDLSSRPDRRAAEWIKQTLPEDAFFLINGIVYTGGASGVGGDAGWWLPILTGRGVVIPPQYALLGEQSSQPGYSDQVNQLVIDLFETSPASTAGKAIICGFPHKITHLYLGQRQGMVIKALPIDPPPRPMLPARELLKDPAFNLIYHQDRVMIFEIDRNLACGPATGREPG